MKTLLVLNLIGVVALLAIGVWTFINVGIVNYNVGLVYTYCVPGQDG